MAIVISTDNIPAVLAEMAEKQDAIEAQLETLTAQLADQTIRADQQDEQDRVQAAALRMAVTQLSTNIRDITRTARRPDGNGNDSDNDNNNGNSTDNPGRRENGNGQRAQSAQAKPQGARGRPARELETEVETIAAIPAGAVAKEPSATEGRRRAHRWM